MGLLAPRVRFCVEVQFSSESAAVTNLCGQVPCAIPVTHTTGDHAYARTTEVTRGGSYRGLSHRAPVGAISISELCNTHQFDSH